MNENEPEIIRGGDNVYADLGYSDAATFKLKAQLVRAMGGVIQDRHLTQSQAAKLMGVGQPEVSKLLRGHFRHFSTDRLLVMLNRLNVDIDITMSDKGREIAGVHMAALELA